MPKVSEFYGIRIYFYFEDHPPPHFHAFYAEHESVIAIESLELIAGFLPSRAYASEQASRPGPIDPIPPLA